MKDCKRAIYFVLLFIQYANGGFYTEEEHIAVLDDNNFEDKIFHKNNAWLIEFYNSWCGHCKKIVPTFKLLASDVQNWANTVKLGAIDCADDKSYRKCREYNLRAYPTFLLFGANITEQVLGEPIDLTPLMKPEYIKSTLANRLQILQKNNNGSKTWTNLQPYIPSSGRKFSHKAETTFILSQKKGSTLAQSVALDFSFLKNAYVTYTEDGEGDSISLKIIQKGQPISHISSIPGTVEDITNIVASRLNITDRELRKVIDFRRDSEESYEEEMSLTDVSHKKVSRPMSGNISDESETVYMVDIENALSYSITHEIVSSKIIDKEAMAALKLFLRIVCQYLPMRRSLHQFMKDFSRYVDAKSLISGKDLTKKIQRLNKEDAFMPQHQQWMGCAGSEEHFRGYPCGLWIMFHTITVNAVLQQDTVSKSDPLRPLKAIHGYIRHFFGCTYCSQHFQEMFSVDAEAFVNTPEDSMVWLWKAHNKVNKRLEGDVTEDPAHKKQPYPSPNACGTCWADAATFDESNVINYLKKVYNNEFLSYEGVQSNFLSKPVISIYPEVKDTDMQLPNTWLDYPDINFCVILYMVSTVVLIALYLLFGSGKRSYFKKS